MDTEKFKKVIADFLSSKGFKRKGNNWFNETDEIIKVVNLQKSYYSRTYYINYGFSIKALPLNTIKMHVYNRVGSIDSDENYRIMELLNLENRIKDKDRMLELIQTLQEKLLPRIEYINTEEDILSELKKRPHLNDVPLIVKKYFKIKQ